MRRGGQEIHVLGPVSERVGSVQGGVGVSFKAPESISLSPASRVYFTFNVFQGDGNRAGGVAPNTDPVAFTLDRPVFFPGGGFTTGVGPAAVGMDVRQQFDFSQYRFESGLVSPFPAGPVIVTVKTGVTVLYFNQDIQSSAAFVTFPDITLNETRSVNQQLFGPTIGGAIHIPIVNPGTGGPSVFVTVGGDITPLFGQTSFHSTQVIACGLCGPDFPVSTVSSATSNQVVLDTNAHVRLSANVSERGRLFGEVGVNSTRRGAFITPANPNQQPLQHRFVDADGYYITAGYLPNY